MKRDYIHIIFLTFAVLASIDLSGQTGICFFPDQPVFLAQKDTAAMYSPLINRGTLITAQKTTPADCIRTLREAAQLPIISPLLRTYIRKLAARA